MEDVAYQYALKVVNGEIIASKKVIKACKRHLRDLERMDDEDFHIFIYLTRLKIQLILSKCCQMLRLVSRILWLISRNLFYRVCMDGERKQM